MKIPSIFLIENKDLEKITCDLLSSNRNLERLLKSCEEFLELQSGISPSLKYEIGAGLAENLVYKKKDVEELSKLLNYDNDPLNSLFLGFYFSALVNKVIEEKDVVRLASGVKLIGLGAYLKKGALVIDGSIGEWSAFNLDGGRLVVFGDTGDYTAHGMKSGLVRVKGCVGGLTGCEARGGKIFAEDVKGCTYNCGAKVYKKGVRIWPPFLDYE